MKRNLIISAFYFNDFNCTIFKQVLVCFRFRSYFDNEYVNTLKSTTKLLFGIIAV